jgi:lipoprotein-releasing system permease protein
MYKLLLCLRYVRTRYIALASIISVTLGVATMIVVNAVMSGFTEEMQDRIQGVLADVSLEARSVNQGFPDPDAHMRAIREIAGDDIESMTPTVYVPAMLNFEINGRNVTRPVQLIGIDERTKSQASQFAEYLQHPENRRQFSFALREKGYDVRDHSGGDDGIVRNGMEMAGWRWRRERLRAEREFRDQMEAIRRSEEERSGGRAAQLVPEPGAPRVFGEMAVDEPFREAISDEIAPEEDPYLSSLSSKELTELLERLADDAETSAAHLPGHPRFDALRNAVSEFSAMARGTSSAQGDPFKSQNPFDIDTALGGGHTFDPLRQQHDGCVVGMGLLSFRDKNGVMQFLALPGDDVQITFPTAGNPPKAATAQFTIVDLYESKMSEYDSQFVFVPIERLQELRGMIEPQSGVTFITSIQIKVKDEAQAEVVRDKLRAAFPESQYHIVTWRDKQGALLAAVSMETMILNVLLFLIIAVAGFGILAIFFMIVVEKTKDIGILKSLGAQSGGVMGIFLSYGLSLGLIGAGAGLVGGLLFVHYINEIADGLAWLTGQEVFDPSIYYFYEIPARVEPATVAWIVAGALAIAVSASVFPALRASRLNPVEALRYG